MGLSGKERKISFGLLIIRAGLAAVLLMHCLPPLLAGTAAWQRIGTPLAFINIGLTPHVLGLAVLLLEALGGICLVSGYFFRIACTLLTVLFALYCFNYFKIGHRMLMLWTLGLAAVLLGLAYTGAGRYSIAVKFEKK